MNGIELTEKEIWMCEQFVLAQYLCDVPDGLTVKKAVEMLKDDCCELEVPDSYVEKGGENLSGLIESLDYDTKQFAKQLIKGRCNSNGQL